MSKPVVFNYLSAMNEHQASDLYLTVGYPPTLRVEDEMVPLGDTNLGPDAVQEIIDSVLNAKQKEAFDHNLELNASLAVGEYGRFRLNILMQRQLPALVIRRIIAEPPSFAELNLPNVLEALALEKRGLILITGTTGSGKSTTLASMIDYRNQNTEGHIVTIEDPIEYFHEHKKCVITQREVGVDTQSYAAALKNVLRQRPDVILVGEIRDREVMEQSLMSAETGHLCLATIHSTNAYQAIERIINFFPEDHASQIRMHLSTDLKAIISQRLVPSVDGGLTPAVEVMLNQGLIRELILKGDNNKIREVMEQNVKQGMCTFDQSLLRLYEAGRITEETAVLNSDRPSDMKIKVQKMELTKADKAYGGAGEALKSVDTSIISLNE